jgi:hypothetical protein
MKEGIFMPKKRNTKRQDGRIAVQVYLGRVDGKRRYKTVYGRTQKEADEKARQIKSEIGLGLNVTADQDTFGQWADILLKIKASHYTQTYSKADFELYSVCCETDIATCRQKSDYSI